VTNEIKISAQNRHKKRVKVNFSASLSLLVSPSAFVDFFFVKATIFSVYKSKVIIVITVFNENKSSGDS